MMNSRVALPCAGSGGAAVWPVALLENSSMYSRSLRVQKFKRAISHKIVVNVECICEVSRGIVIRWVTLPACWNTAGFIACHF